MILRQCCLSGKIAANLRNFKRKAIGMQRVKFLDDVKMKFNVTKIKFITLLEYGPPLWERLGSLPLQVN